MSVGGGETPITFDPRESRGLTFAPIIHTQLFCCCKALNFAFASFLLPCRSDPSERTCTWAAFTAKVVCPVDRSMWQDADLKAFRLY